MNIVTAPIANLAPAIVAGSGGLKNLTAGPDKDLPINFLGFGTVLCLVLIFAGVYFIIAGQESAVELETPLGTLKTGAVGIVLIFIGASLYLGIGKILIDRAKES